MQNICWICFGIDKLFYICKNKFVEHQNNNKIMLQATSIYSQGDGEKWQPHEMMEVMMDIARTSLDVLGNDLDT